MSLSMEKERKVKEEKEQERVGQSSRAGRCRKLHMMYVCLYVVSAMESTRETGWDT